MARRINPKEDEDERGEALEQDSNSLPRRPGQGRHGLPLNLAIPFVHRPPSREDVQEGGQILFQQYVRDEIQQHPLIPQDSVPLVQQALSEAGDDVDVSASPPSASGGATPRYRRGEAYAGIRFMMNDSTARVSTPEGYKRWDWSKMGRNIREMADSFARSREGESVRHQAEEVNLIDINEESFSELLVELFNTGLSLERVIALFYFCSTLIIRAASNNSLDLTRFLFIWSLRFIKDRVCDWVYRNGGWENVLSKISQGVLTVGLIILVGTLIGCGFVYIKKNW